MYVCSMYIEFKLTSELDLYGNALAKPPSVHVMEVTLIMIALSVLLDECR
jgi:hypothetical protein